jgi:hypothetical protein
MVDSSFQNIEFRYAQKQRVSIKNIFSGLVWQTMIVVAALMVKTTKIVSKKERTRFPRLVALHC